MIKALCFLLAAFLSFTSHAQSFEGRITYDNHIQSKVSDVTDEQFTHMLGNTQEYYCKGNQYKSVCNGAVLQWQLYTPGNNRLYNKMSNSNIAYWNDAAQNKDSILHVERVANADTILGYPCDKLVLSCLGGTQVYWFNKTVAPVNPALFVRHKLENWYAIISITHALPLKFTLDNPQFTLTSIAVEVKRMSVADSFFALPPGTPTKQSSE